VIGVYDSGYGGLSVLKHLQEALPERDFVYLGDSGRAPYGGRDVHTILDFAEQCVERLFEEGCRVIVVACHTVSCVALRHLQQRYCPVDGDRRILGVTIPGAEAAIATGAQHIAVVATARTVASGTWTTELHKLARVRVTERAAPLLAGIVEEGWEDTDLARSAVERYVADLHDADTIVLGCTHYPLLERAFARALGDGVAVLDPGPVVAERLAAWLQRHPDFDAPGAGSLRVLCSGDPAAFARHGARFLGAPLPLVEPITEVAGRLAHRHPDDAPRGQVVR